VRGVADDFELDCSNSIGPLKGVYRGGGGAREVWASLLDAWTTVQWDPVEVIDVDDSQVIVVNRLHMRGRGIYVATLKSQDGPEIQVHGSPGLIQTLLEHDLIDEFRVWIFPVVLGTGKRLFGDGAIPAALKLVDSKVSNTCDVSRRAQRPDPCRQPGELRLVLDRCTACFSRRT
jgi:dihydrofolate reductase